MRNTDTPFRRIQGLLAKAAQGEDEDELERDLDEDMEDYDRLRKGARDEDEGEDDLEDFEMDFEDEEEGEEEPPARVQKAPEGEGEEEREHALLRTLLQVVQALDKRLRAIEEAQATVAKAVHRLGLKVEHAQDTPRLPKSGRRLAKGYVDPARDAAEIMAKAVQAKDLFSAYDVAALESMLSRGDYEAIVRRFSPAQLRALGLE